MSDGDNPTLFTQDDTGNYVEYTPPTPPAFKDTLPEEIRDSEHLNGVEDSSQLATYYVDLKKDWLAPPESPEGYEFEPPNGLVYTDEQVADFKNWAFENKINQKTFAAMVEREHAQAVALDNQLKQRIENNQKEAESELKKEWGGQYDHKVESAKQFLNKFGDDDFKEFLEQTRFGDNPKVVRLFAKLAESISEDAFIKPGDGRDVEPKRKRGIDGKAMLKFPSMEKKE